MIAVYRTLFNDEVWLVDFQAYNPDGTYPAVLQIAADGSTPTPFQDDPLVNIYITVGPIVSSLIQVKKMALVLHETHFMNIAGGKRTKRKTRSQKRKGKKASTRHLRYKPKK